MHNEMWDILNTPPSFDTKATLTIEALSPLSMVVKMPGKYYRSQREPSHAMLYGLLENTLGWHIDSTVRRELVKKLEKKHKMKTSSSDVGYTSLLQFHVKFGLPWLPPVQHFQDLWSQHLHGGNFATGSRNYSFKVIPLINASRAGRVKIEERAGFRKDPEAVVSFKENDEIHINALRPYFPQYYVSPTPREYVIPQGNYVYMVETSASLAAILKNACQDPAAPLYLGSNDGWVELTWEVMQ